METIQDAEDMAWELICSMRRTLNDQAVAEVITDSRRYRQELNCCPAGAYAMYLADAAVREVTRG